MLFLIYIAITVSMHLHVYYFMSLISVSFPYLFQNFEKCVIKKSRVSSPDEKFFFVLIVWPFSPILKKIMYARIIKKFLFTFCLI